jgi:ketosteroid isomerase-like protein
MNTRNMMSTALKFNEKINKQDLKGLTELMTEDHTFIDSEGKTVKGKSAMKKGWRQFFEKYPDYLNIFTCATTQNNLVVMVGYSTCSYKPLSGANVWTAKIRGKRVSEWRVYWLDRK